MASLELKFTIPGQIAQKVLLDQATMMVGTLLSNHVVLRASGVEPIHALIEATDGGGWMVTDLGSSTGVKLNGDLIDIESPIADGDRLTIGTVDLFVVAVEEAEVVAPIGGMSVASASENAKATPGKGGFLASDPSSSGESPKEKSSAEKKDTVDGSRRFGDHKPVLFSPRDARPGGGVLEVVAYWGETILEVDHFEKGLKGFEEVTIGDPTKAHFIAAGKESLTEYSLAEMREDGYKLRLRKGMEARLRRGGKVEKAGPGSHKLGRRDIAHIKYGAVRYFLLFVRPPELKLPKMGPKDTFFLGLMAVAMFFYMILIPTLWMSEPVEKDKDKDDIWSIVHVPEANKPKPKAPKKPPVKLAKIKKPPPPKKTPPKPKPKPVKPAKPVVKPKVKQPKPVKKPTPKTKVEKAFKPDKVAKRPKPKKTPKKQAGMASTGSKRPNFKLAGAKKPGRKGRSGGAKGSGMRKRGGARKGKGKVNLKGVEGVKNKKASGVNLGKLGIGVGKVLSKSGPGAVRTNFRSSAGGAGGGSGTATRNLGLGGLGNGKSLGVAGTGSAVNNFGQGSGGLLGGEGGSGGLGGLGNSFGRGRGRSQVPINIPVVAPAISGGLTSQEVLAVIRTHLNEIRHCYEQLLQRSPNASGKINSSFVVGTSGRVTSSKIKSSTIADSRMRSCVTGRIKRWKFPRPRGGQAVSINYPFTFNPL